MSKKDKLNNKVSVSRSPAMICSVDAAGKDAERKPPGFKYVKSCESCAHRLGYRTIDEDIFCKLYEYHKTPEMICDSYD